jgi:hypothetical protein
MWFFLFWKLMSFISGKLSSSKWNLCVWHLSLPPQSVPFQKHLWLSGWHSSLLFLKNISSTLFSVQVGFFTLIILLFFPRLVWWWLFEHFFRAFYSCFMNVTFLLLFSVVLGFELRVLCSTTWAMFPTLFALVVFSIGSCGFAQDHDSPIYIACVAGITRACHYVQL